jgi:hypothetical protein
MRDEGKSLRGMQNGWLASWRAVVRSCGRADPAREMVLDFLALHPRLFPCSRHCHLHRHLQTEVDGS